MDTRTVTITFAPLAENYERVHYVGHALFNPNLTKENLMGVAHEIEKQIFLETGYRAFVRDIRVKHYADLYSDVDFVIDSPTESPIAPAVIIGILKAIALVIAALAVLGVVIWLFWTVYIEKEKVYVCEQCPDFPSFSGWDQYVAHLKAAHPEKYEAVEKSGADDWFTKPIMAAGGVILLLIVLLMLIERRR